MLFFGAERLSSKQSEASTGWMGWLISWPPLGTIGHLGIQSLMS